jgi:hypothetical protein
MSISRLGELLPGTMLYNKDEWLLVLAVTNTVKSNQKKITWYGFSRHNSGIKCRTFIGHDPIGEQWTHLVVP